MMNHQGFFYTSGEFIRFWDRVMDRTNTICQIKEQRKRERICAQLNKTTESRATEREKEMTEIFDERR